MAELGQTLELRGVAVHRRMVDLEVARVNDDAGRRMQRDAASVRDAMADVEVLGRDVPELQRIAGVHQTQVAPP